MIQCFDLWVIVYNFLDSRNKWKMGYQVCKDFNKFIINDLKTVERMIIEEDILQHDIYWYPGFDQNELFGSTYDHIFIDYYIINKLTIDPSTISINIGNFGSSIISISLEYCNNNYRVLTCTFDGFGLFREYQISPYRWIYKINNKNNWIYRSDEFSNFLSDNDCCDPEIIKSMIQISEFINQCILVDCIFPDIYQIITDKSRELLNRFKLIKKTNISMDNKFVQYFKNLQIDSKGYKQPVIVLPENNSSHSLSEQ